MDLMGEFESISKDFVKFRALVAETQAETLDEASRYYLNDLSKAMDDAFAQVKTLFPETVAILKKEQADSQQAVAKLADEIDAVGKKMDAMPAPPEIVVPEPEVAPPPEPEWDESSIDADLRQYRLELLDLLDHGKRKEARKMESRDVWQDLSRMEEPGGK